MVRLHFFLDEGHAFFIPDVYVIGLCALKSLIFILIPWLRIHWYRVRNCRALGLNLYVSMCCCVRPGNLFMPQCSYLLRRVIEPTYLKVLCEDNGSAGKVLITGLNTQASLSCIGQAVRCSNSFGPQRELHVSENPVKQMSYVLLIFLDSVFSKTD